MDDTENDAQKMHAHKNAQHDRVCPEHYYIRDFDGVCPLCWLRENAGRTTGKPPTELNTDGRNDLPASQRA